MCRLVDEPNPCVYTHVKDPVVHVSLVDYGNTQHAVKSG